VRREVENFLAGRGVAAERLSAFAKLPHKQFWALHGEVDIALDPFPFNGGTTTCETLWLGVPLITCTGGVNSFLQRFASRMGLAFLNSIGLSELAASDEQNYATLAVDLANDPARMVRLRETLRSKMAVSPLMDEPRFVREVEAAYRTMWRQWCGYQ